MTETRTITDSGGNPRKMTLISNQNGTKIYEERGTWVVAAFFDYDSHDESARWAESLAQLAEQYPQAEIDVA